MLAVLHLGKSPTSGSLGAEPEMDLVAFSHTNQCQLYYTLENPQPLGTLGLNAFNDLLTYETCFLVFCLCISSLNSVQVSCRTCHRSIQISFSGGTLLDRDSWLTTVPSMLEDVSHQCPIMKDLIMD